MLVALAPSSWCTRGAVEPPDAVEIAGYRIESELARGGRGSSPRNLIHDCSNP